MTDLQRPQITSSGSRGKRGRYTLDSPPPAAHVSYAQNIVGTQYGWVKIINPEKRWNEQWSRCYVLTECVSCHNIQWTYLSNLTRGISKGCQNCSQRPKLIPMWLEQRLTAAKGRCENPNDRQYVIHAPNVYLRAWLPRPVPLARQGFGSCQRAIIRRVSR